MYFVVQISLIFILFKTQTWLLIFLKQTVVIHVVSRGIDNVDSSFSHNEQHVSGMADPFQDSKAIPNPDAIVVREKHKIK